MKWGCCGDVERIASIAASGYDYIESPVRALEVANPKGSADNLVEQVSKTGLSVEAFNVFIPAPLRIVGPDVDENALNHHIRTTVDRSNDLGTEIIVLGSGGSRQIPDEWSASTARHQFLAFCELAADAVSSAGITIAIEPLAESVCNFILTVAEGRELAKASGRDEISFLADLYHMHMNNDPVEGLKDIAGEISHVHLPVPNIPGQIDHEPEFDHAGYLRALKHGGYEGQISIEDNGKRFSDFDREAGLVLQYLKEIWASV